MDNPKQIVAQGYDNITQSYLNLIDSMGPAVRGKYLMFITSTLPPGACILELGCGAGIPMTEMLSANYNVVGVDISEKQLLLATRNVPEANFILGDMTNLGFSGEAFDAVAAFYSITHVPRNEHFQLLTDIYRMLKPGGLLIATMGAGDTPDSVEDDWLGAPMFFSHFDGDRNEALVTDAGFNIISAVDENEFEYDQPVRFRWIVARKP
ncbi:class I SAM-dependent methyltransferase [Chloroflexota bacterium]